jgi:hypothetical protein
MRKTLTALALMLAFGANAYGQAKDDGAASGGVSLKVETSKPEYAVGEDFNFTITFHNGGEEKYLYGGMALGRKRIWNSVECAMTDEEQREIRLGLTWGVAFVAGRLDPFAIHLKSGESYALNVTRKDYLFFDYRPAGINQLAERLPTGRYKLRCTYKTRPQDEMKTLAVWKGDEFIQLWERRPEQTPKVWEGSATSDEYSFRVITPKRTSHGNTSR